MELIRIMTFFFKNKLGFEILSSLKKMWIDPLNMNWKGHMLYQSESYTESNIHHKPGQGKKR